MLRAIGCSKKRQSCLRLEVDDIVEELKGLTLLEASELVKAIEDPPRKHLAEEPFEQSKPSEFRRRLAWTRLLRQGPLLWLPLVLPVVVRLQRRAETLHAARATFHPATRVLPQMPEVLRCVRMC